MPSMTEECISTDFLVLSSESFSLVRTPKNILKPLNMHSPSPPDSMLFCTQYCKWGIFLFCLLPTLSPSLLLSLPFSRVRNTCSCFPTSRSGLSPANISAKFYWPEIYLEKQYLTGWALYLIKEEKPTANGFGEVLMTQDTK